MQVLLPLISLLFCIINMVLPVVNPFYIKSFVYFPLDIPIRTVYSSFNELNGGPIMLNEELLSAWLRLGAVIDNQRLVSDLPFNEAMVCGLLLRAQERGCALTASDLCAQTRILKSQMNAILQSLEKKGYLQRQRSRTDLRRIELSLLPAGVCHYLESHRQTLSLVDRLIASMGQDTIKTLIPLLLQVADNFDHILKEV